MAVSDEPWGETVKDLWGDPIKVTPFGGLNEVSLTVSDSENSKGPVTAYYVLSAKQARKLAKMLKRAAKEAESHG